MIGLPRLGVGAVIRFVALTFAPKSREREYIMRVMAETPTLAAAAGRLGIEAVGDLAH